MVFISFVVLVNVCCLIFLFMLLINVICLVKVVISLCLLVGEVKNLLKNKSVLGWSFLGRMIFCLMLNWYLVIMLFINLLMVFNFCKYVWILFLLVIGCWYCIVVGS